MTEYNEITGDLVAVSSDHPVLLNYKKQIDDLTKQLEDKTKQYDYNYNLLTERGNKWRLKEAQLETKLKELLDDESIEFEYAKDIADIFDLSLTKMVEVEYTISATANVEVPYNADSDRVADNVFVERIEFYSQDYDFEVLESDFDVEDYRVRD